jgi:5-formyltetrahydrofolate cyclo-ligase
MPNEEKNALRDMIKKRINDLTQQEKELKSKQICFKLLSLDLLKGSQYLGIYASTEFEVSTHYLIEDLLKTKHITVPFIQENTMKIGRIENLADLTTGVFNILEPKVKKEFTKELGIHIIPGVGFDRNGNRLGRGHGYYDKFLQNKTGLKIGLAFDEQIVDNLHSEAHDIVMDLIITDKELIRIRLHEK